MTQSDLQETSGRQGGAGMKIGIIAIVLLLVAGVIYLRDFNEAGIRTELQSTAVSPDAPVTTPSSADPLPVVSKTLPRLVDLGAHSCIPCKMMAPILDDLKANYGDRFRTIFIDVRENHSAGAQYGIRVIPTQVFYDENGRELGRHEGFLSREDILSTWRRFGYDFGS